ncbi:hypothetical protein ACP4OV_029850 [Aristida adscensionis]
MEGRETDRSTPPLPIPPSFSPQSFEAVPGHGGFGAGSGGASPGRGGPWPAVVGVPPATHLLAAEGRLSLVALSLVGIADIGDPALGDQRVHAFGHP